MQNQTHNDWTIEFAKNIHMYCHSLKATKHDQTFDVPCEDTPSGFVAIWPYELNLAGPLYEDLLEGLREWADQSGMTYVLYETRDGHETNDIRL